MTLFELPLSGPCSSYDHGLSDRASPHGGGLKFV
jgi:hypothetical protein